MIHVDRSRVPPPRGWAKIQKLAAAKLSERRWSRDLWLEARPALQPALEKLFHSKCAYCESPTTGVARGEIDHFRPRHNAAGLDARDIDPEHYLWLGYTWENLYLCCVRCNHHKRNLFPVSGRRARFGATSDELAAEKALLLDPCVGDPAASLDFRLNGKVRPLDERGDVTVRVLGLNRSDLVAARARVGEECRELALAIRKMGRPFSDPLLREFEERRADEAPHAAVARAAWPELSQGEVPQRGQPEKRPRKRAAKPMPKARLSKRRERIRRKAKMLEAIWVDEIEIRDFYCLRHCSLRFPAADEEPQTERGVVPASSEESRQPWLALIGRARRRRAADRQLVRALLDPGQRHSGPRGEAPAAHPKAPDPEGGGRDTAGARRAAAAALRHPGRDVR